MAPPHPWAALEMPILNRVKDFLILFSAFVRKKVTINENIVLQILCPGSGQQTPPKWPKIWKMKMTSQSLDMLFSSFFDAFCFSSSLVTGPSFMSILSLVLELWLFYKELTRNPEIGNTPVWVFPNIWRSGRVMDTWFGMNTSNRILVNAAKCEVIAFTVFELLRENQLGQKGGGKITPPSHPD